MASLPIVSVGYECAVRPDYKDYLKEVKAPGNYKKAEVIAEYIQNAEIKQQLEASGGTFTGKLSKIAIFHCYPDGRHEDKLVTSIDIKAIPSINEDKLLVIPRMNLLFQLAAIESLITEKDDVLRFLRPWGQKVIQFQDMAGRLVDPFLQIFGSEAKDLEGAQLGLKRVGLEVKEHAPGSAEWWAVAAARLAHKARMHLVP